MSLHIHRSQRADQLATALAAMLKTPPTDVFESEIVVVPAHGIERWLTQRLSHELGSGRSGGDGICAGVEFLLPWQFARHALGVPRWDAWAPDRLVWPLLAVIDAALDEPWLGTLANHIGRGGDTPQDRHRRGRRFAVARRLAGLFDSYAGYRPTMLQAWAQGADHDGYGLELPRDLAWQPQLWRRVRELVGTADPVSQLEQWQQTIGSGQLPSMLPDRVSYFGPTRMTARDLQIISTLSQQREVHLWLPHPSPDLWRRLTPRSAADGAAMGLERRRCDRTVLLPRNRLLSALGRDSRELQLAIGSVDPIALSSGDEVGSGRAAGDAGTLLQRLQMVIALDLPAERVEAAVLDQSDRSIQVHACHGSIRQVEVLREVIVGLLADDPTLQPRDILVMCPDIDHYSPLITATFGLADAVPSAHPGQQLPVSVADRSITRTNPIVAALQRVLSLVDGRAGAGEILELANMPPVRRRFAFSIDEMEQLVRWTGQAAIGWGLDTAQRSSFQMESIVQGTWRSGLDRILLGVTMADEGRNWLSVALPVDDVASSDIDLAGRFAEFLDRLTTSARSLSGETTLGRWMKVIGEVLHELVEVSEADQWQLDQVTGLLADIAQECDIHAETTILTLADIRQLLHGRLGPRPTRGNFRTGGLTFCTMVPMRSVPQRVICLLGLDDGVFPRAARQDGDDVLARNPVVGERDVRGEDRQLMLDALLAAQDTVAIFYSGSDERSGVDRPPAVPVGELLDTLDEIAVVADGSAARRQILTRHPLQPFDRRNFTSTPSFSFDRQAWSATQVMDSASPPPPFLSAPLPPAPILDVELAKMVQLLQHPARGFLEQRLQIAAPDEPREMTDLLPVELDSLQRWEVGRRLLTGRLAGNDVATCRQAEYRRGLLPPGPLGTAVLDEILAEVEPLVQAWTDLPGRESRVLGVVTATAQRSGAAGMRQVRGTVTVRDQSIVTLTFSKLSPLHRLRTWIELIALTAARGELPVRGITIGRGSTGRARQFTVGPLTHDTAAELLAELVTLYDAGLCQPLPMAARTSCAYASARRDRATVDDAEQAAEQNWFSGRFPGENDEPSNIRVWGADAPLAALLNAPASQWPEGGSDSVAEPTRFGELALKLWVPMLKNEQVQWL